MVQNCSRIYYMLIGRSMVSMMNLRNLEADHIGNNGGPVVNPSHQTSLPSPQTKNPPLGHVIPNPMGMM